MAEVSTSVLASREGLEEGDSSSLRLEMGLAASPRTWRTFLPEAGGKKKQWKINYLLFVLLNFEPLRDVFFKIQVKNRTFDTIEDFTKDTVFFLTKELAGILCLKGVEMLAKLEPAHARRPVSDGFRCFPSFVRNFGGRQSRVCKRRSCSSMRAMRLVYGYGFVPCATGPRCPHKTQA